MPRRSMIDPQQTPGPANACGSHHEEALNLYLDGELPLGDEAALFRHLAACTACRRVLGALIEFRRMSRQEALAVPAAVDDAFFGKLDHLRHRTTLSDRSAQRRPLWQLHTRISLRVAAAVAGVLFFAGFLIPRDLGTLPPMPRVEGLDERVELPPVFQPAGEAVYVFYPGLTVEAARLPDEAL